VKKKPAKKTLSKPSKFVIVRSTGAGVHCGVLVSKSDSSVTLRNARRIWRWFGANTLNELSQKGAEESRTRIAEPVPEISISGWHEIIPCSKLATENLSRSRWGA
jgi:hypothetical protein